MEKERQRAYHGFVVNCFVLGPFVQAGLALLRAMIFTTSPRGKGLGEIYSSVLLPIIFMPTYVERLFCGSAGGAPIRVLINNPICLMQIVILTPLLLIPSHGACAEGQENNK